MDEWKEGERRERVGGQGIKGWRIKGIDVWMDGETRNEGKYGGWRERKGGREE